MKYRFEYLLWKIGFYRYCHPCDEISLWWSREHQGHHCGSITMTDALRRMLQRIHDDEQGNGHG